VCNQQSSCRPGPWGSLLPSAATLHHSRGWRYAGCVPAKQGPLALQSALFLFSEEPVEASWRAGRWALGAKRWRPVIGLLGGSFHSAVVLIKEAWRPGGRQHLILFHCGRICSAAAARCEPSALGRQPAVCNACGPGHGHGQAGRSADVQIHGPASCQAARPLLVRLAARGASTGKHTGELARPSACLHSWCLMADTHAMALPSTQPAEHCSRCSPNFQKCYLRT
jgi:hypothetical protein